MNFTTEETRVLRPYLVARPGSGKGWRAGVAAGALVGAFGLAAGAANFWPALSPYSPLVIVLGLVVVDASMHYRRRAMLSGIIQKYDEAVRQLLTQLEGEEETL